VPAGAVPPVIVKPLPEMDSALMISGVVSHAVSVTESVFAVFSCIVPKFRTVGWTEPNL
jgi:hypothetical protein